MKIIITGTTGHTHPKLEEYIVPDFMALEPGDPKENITFVYLSGAGNYNSKTQMWVRVKKSTEDAVLLLGHVPVLQARRYVEQDERGRGRNDRRIQERIPQGRHRMQGYI